ncbi:hypothetical protein G7Y89_g5141 [Cudoniella acicularis]|uniref:Uncharacterized protein n=1 Tax=Cudoniella acicularis TaxID=354080 RepID=A0A8H4RQ49_9HELO|nr:hypothetical protein G7Y89_g5141 [Cudoniella acicularis]
MIKDADRDREDREMFQKYNILFKGPACPWPIHHMKTFQNIRLLGLTQFSTYGNGDLESVIWKAETKARAQYLVDTTSKLTGNKPSEMQWRLDLEKIVYKRFELDIDWYERIFPDQHVRLYLIFNSPEPISLEERRNTRSACCCSAEIRLKNQATLGLNHIFDYRADELIVHGGEAQFDLRPRKPDRVYGLQQTKKFDRTMRKFSNAIQDRVAGATDVTKSRSIIEFTPFEERKRPLIFPFLISEAKTERGDSFDACERQTAFPIWKLLRLQEELQIRAKQLLSEQGGPLVWFFANRGEDWRLYGCYLDTEEDNEDEENLSTSYNIQCLWSGRVDSRNGALQILLLVDYIFDWARDLYRPGVIQLLKALSKNELDEDASISSDTDILSTKQKIAAWQAQLTAVADIASVPLASDMASLELSTNEPSTPNTSPEVMSTSHPSISDASSSDSSSLDTLTPKLRATETSTLDTWLSEYHEKLQKKWRNTDTVDGAFRPQHIVETCFVCMNLEGDTFSKKFVPALTPRLPYGNLREHSRAMSRALYRTSLMISDEVLQYLEEHFIRGKRSSKRHAQTSDNKHVIMLIHNCITREWQLKRTLICIVFDQSGLEDLLAQAEYQRPVIGAQADPPSQYQLTVQDMDALVDVLKSQYITDVLAAAIESRTLEVYKEDASSDDISARNCPNGRISELIAVVQDLVSTQPLTPIAPHFFVSIQVEESIRWLFPDLEPEHSLEEESFLGTSSHLRRRLRQSRSGIVLVHSKNIRDMGSTQAPEWCIFTFNHKYEPPNIKEQFKKLDDLNTLDGFYIINHSLDRVNASSEWRPFQGRHSVNSDPNRALLHWKTTLTHINIIHEISKLANKQALALSGCLKRSLSGNMDSTTGAKKIKLDLSQVKQEMAEMQPDFNLREN